MFFISQLMVHIFTKHTLIQLISVIKILIITLFFYKSNAKSNQLYPESLPIIKSFTPTEYGAGIQNWDVDQGPNGVIYVANNFGLLLFNGQDWKLLEIPSSTKTRSVQVLDKNKRIYVGGQGQIGFFQESGDGYQYTSLNGLIPHSIAFDEVWNIVEAYDLIFANVSGRIVIISGEQAHLDTSIFDVEFIELLDNKLVVGHAGGISEYDQHSGSFRLVAKIPDSDPRGVVKREYGYLVFTYAGHIYEINKQGSGRVNNHVSQFLEKSKVNQVKALSDGQIAVATQNDGLIIFNKQYRVIHHLTKNRGLNHRTVVSLFEDSFHNLWLGLNNGICFVELNTPFSLINENLGLEGTGYSAVAVDNDYYLGTSSGFYRSNSSKDHNINIDYHPVESTKGLVNGISRIGNQMIVCHHEGFFLNGKPTSSHFFEKKGGWKVVPYRDNLILGGTYDGFYLFESIHDSYQLVNKVKGINHSSRVFEFSDDSTLWMTHGYKGAYRLIIKDNTIQDVKHYGRDHGFPSDILISVYKLNDELVFTAEKGVFHYQEDQDRFVAHPFLSKWFRYKHVSKLAEAPNGDIYFIADRQVGYLERESIGIYKLHSKRFLKINHLLSDDLENINILNENSILFGAKEGFILYKTQHEEVPPHPFRVILSKIIVSFSSQETKEIHSSYFHAPYFTKPQSIKFEYAVPYFDGLSNLKFSYSLLPYNVDWSDWSDTNWKEYTNLPAGDYEFQVKALNIYQDESQVSTRPFAIIPIWYESQLAYFIYFLFFLSGLGLVFYKREEKHKQEKYVINKSMDEAIKSKEREINEFSEKTSQQIQSIRNENLKKEINHKNNQLASVTMHLLSKNEFVNSIRKKLDEAITNNNLESIKKIVKSIDHNLEREDSWETFVYHFDQVHGNFLKKLKQEVKLTNQETKLCAYLKMNMSTKDIASLMNITVRGVELARYRLRKKLGLNRETNLVSYLESY